VITVHQTEPDISCITSRYSVPLLLLVRLSLGRHYQSARLAYRDEEEIQIALDARRGEETVAELIEPSGS
jgi:hypothetical protein